MPLNPRGGRPYWRLQAQVHATETTCILCDLPVLKAANGFEPPTWLLHEKHRGQSVTEGMVAVARAEHLRDRSAKGKGKRRPRTKPVT